MQLRSGYLPVDKPPGMTSRDVVNHVQAWFPKKKLGHAGTLDPAATGLLIIGVGSIATRFIEYVQAQEKQYRSVFQLGSTSTTDDVDGEITEKTVVEPPSLELIQDQLTKLTGAIMQTPPAYSAARVMGVRAHTRSRRGETVELKPRQISVYEFQCLRYHFPELEVMVNCSKGTYIRSLARDLGQILQIGAYVKALRRTRIGKVNVEDAINLDCCADEAIKAMLPVSVAVQHLPRLVASDEETKRLRQGQIILTTSQITGEMGLWNRDTFIGIVKCGEDRVITPTKMIPSEVTGLD